MLPSTKAARLDILLLLPMPPAPSCVNICSRRPQVWTEKGVVYGSVINGLIDDETTFVIPKSEPKLIIGPYEKGDDVSPHL